MREVAIDVLRPISRKYDRQEHDDPVELAALDRRNPSAGPSRALVMEQAASWNDAAVEGSKNGQAMANVLAIEQMSWGDIGLMLAVPGMGLGNAAINAVATPEQ